MADALQTQETGGGEGAPAPLATPSQDPKPASSEAQDVKTVAGEPQQIPEQTEAKKEPEPEPIQPVEAKQEEVTPTEVKPTAESSVDQNGNDVAQNNTDTKDANWQQRELELLKKIEELEKVKIERSEDGLKLELKVREEEIDLLKARVKNLETELQAALSKPSGKNHEMIENIKQQHEELLSKARGMIFDKTKMVKNQELQIEALTTQVQSLKDINQITKDLLEIRNSEIKAMEDRLAVMETRFKTEKERFGLVLQRAQTSSNINGDLKKEYETQLAIFKELREKYEQRVKALVAENERLKASITPNDTSGGSTSAMK